MSNVFIFEVRDYSAVGVVEVQFNCLAVESGKELNFLGSEIGDKGLLSGGVIKDYSRSMVLTFFQALNWITIQKPE